MQRLSCGGSGGICLSDEKYSKIGVQFPGSRGDILTRMGSYTEQATAQPVANPEDNTLGRRAVRVRLTGWQRLWVVVSVVYLLAVAAAVALFWPSPEITFHRDEFTRRMPAESRLSLREIYAGEYPAKEDRSDGPSVEMPNGAVLVFTKTVPDAKMESVARDYWTIVEASSKEQRISLIGYGVLAWLVPCLGLYALGWAIGWVYRGFKPKPPEGVSISTKKHDGIGSL